MQINQTEIKDIHTQDLALEVEKEKEKRKKKEILIMIGKETEKKIEIEIIKRNIIKIIEIITNINTKINSTQAIIPPM